MHVREVAQDSDVVPMIEAEGATGLRWVTSSDGRKELVSANQDDSLLDNVRGASAKHRRSSKAL